MAKAMSKLSSFEGLDPSESTKSLDLLGLAREDRDDLVSAIHDQLIPQLAMAHLGGLLSDEQCPEERGPPTPVEVAELARLAVTQDLLAALRFVESLSQEGLSLEVILLNLVAPAARLLGDQWLDDESTFVEVTMGLSTLQQIVHVLGPSFAPTAAHRGFVLLTTAPPEQHTLGLYLLGEFLRREGWGVQVTPGMSEAELVAFVAEDSIEMVGISISNSELLGRVTHIIESITRASANPKMVVLLGGALDLSSYASDVGVKYCADPRDAVRWLDNRHCATSPTWRTS